MNNITLSFQVTEDIFSPIIVFDERDIARNTPATYLPQKIDVQNQHIPTWMVEDAWTAYRAKSKGLDQTEIEGETTYTRLTTPYKLARYGLQVVRIYAPEDYKITLELMDEPIVRGKWGISRFSIMGEWWREMYDWHVLSVETRRLPFYKVYVFPGNTGDYNPYEQTGVTYKFVGGQKVEEPILEWRPAYEVKIEKDMIKETLTFSGSKAERLKYWYTNGAGLKVLKISKFFNQWGDEISPPINAQNNLCADEINPVTNEIIPQVAQVPSAWFRTKEEAWGMIIVEYEVPYHYWHVLYDIIPEKSDYTDKVVREFDLTASVERTGFVTLDKDGKREQFGLLPQNDALGFNKYEVEGENQSTLYEKGALPPEDPDEAGGLKETDVVYHLKLFVHLKFKSFTPRAINLFCSAKKGGEIIKEGVVEKMEPVIFCGTATANFSPTVDFNDAVYDELPKMCLYQRRRRVLYDSGVTIDHIEDLSYIDFLGGITTEKMDVKEDLAND